MPKSEPLQNKYRTDEWSKLDPTSMQAVVAKTNENRLATGEEQHTASRTLDKVTRNVNLGKPGASAELAKAQADFERIKDVNLDAEMLFDESKSAAFHALEREQPKAVAALQGQADTLKAEAATARTEIAKLVAAIIPHAARLLPGATASHLHHLLGQLSRTLRCGARAGEPVFSEICNEPVSSYPRLFKDSQEASTRMIAAAVRACPDRTIKQDLEALERRIEKTKSPAWVRVEHARLLAEIGCDVPAEIPASTVPDDPEPLDDSAADEDPDDDAFDDVEPVAIGATDPGSDLLFDAPDEMIDD